MLTAETQRKMEEAVGFRNVIAHQYGDIDHEVVYDTLHEDLMWFERFQQQVATWVRERAQ